MAIRYINDLNLSNSKLQNAVIDPLSSAPSGALEGQIYYDTNTDKLQLYTGSGWVPIQSGNELNTTYTFNVPTLTTTLRLTGSDATTNDVAITGSGTTTVTRTSATELTISSADQYTGTVTSIIPAADNGSGSAITASGTISILGGTNVTTSITGTTVTIDSTDQFVGTVTNVATGAGLTGGPITTTGTISPNYSGSSNIILSSGALVTPIGGDTLIVSSASTGNVHKALINTLSLSSLASPIADLSVNKYKITNLVDPTATQDAATKNYVDTTFAGSGALIYQGGYNASTNSPDLTTSPNSIKKGWTYTVTVDGTFFTEQVRVGDVVIANSDNPSALSDWTTVQSNIDLASTTTVGIASFSSDNFAVSAAGEVTIKNGGVELGVETTGSYNPTVGTDTDIDVGNNTTSGIDIINTISLTDGVITSFTTETAQSASETNPGVILIASNAEATAGSNTTKAVNPFQLISNIDSGHTSRGYATTITASGTVTHNLNTFDVMVELYDTVINDTVYAEVVRTGNNTISVIFGATPANPIRVLVTSVGI